MTGPIGYGTVAGPVDTDFADGVLAFDALAATFENNLNATNAYAPKVPSAVASQTALWGSQFFTPYTGWGWPEVAMESGMGGQASYARKWGGLTFFRLELNRTGANITAGSGGNITDVKIGTFAVGWRPITTFLFMVGTASDFFPVCYTIDGGGLTSLVALNQASAVFGTGYHAIMMGIFINRDPQPL